jgi:hypothetical protein
VAVAANASEQPPVGAPSAGAATRLAQHRLCELRCERSTSAVGVAAVDGGGASRTDGGGAPRSRPSLLMPPTAASGGCAWRPEGSSNHPHLRTGLWPLLQSDLNPLDTSLSGPLAAAHRRLSRRPMASTRRY